MCCVIPPFSWAATSRPRIRSKSDVFPWSTWPRKVTTGGRGSSVSGSSGRSAAANNCSSSDTGWRKSTSTPRLKATRAAISWVMLEVITPGMSSFMSSWSTRAAGTPRASEKLRTVQGISITTLLLRGAAVQTPGRRRRRGARGVTRAASSSGSSRRPFSRATRLRFNCRCSRPARARPGSSSAWAAIGLPRRARSFSRSRPGSTGSAGGSPAAGARSTGDALPGGGPFFLSCS